MTLNEAIEKEKRLAVTNCNMATVYHTDENIYSKEEETCRERAEYHAQIAEWLSELNAYRKADKEVSVDDSN